MSNHKEDQDKDELVALQFTHLIFNAEDLVTPQAKPRGKAPTPEVIDTDERKLEVLDSVIIAPELPNESNEEEEEEPEVTVSSLKSQAIRKTFRIVSTNCFAMDSLGKIEKSSQIMVVKGHHLSFLNKDTIGKFQSILFLARVARRTDKKNREYLHLVKLLGTTFNWITNNTITTVLTNDAKMSINKVKNILNRTHLKRGEPDGFMSFETFAGNLAVLDTENPESEILKTIHANMILFLSFAKSPKQVLQFCFPQDWKTIETMSPILFERFVTLFSNNVVGFFFKERCKEFGLSAPLHIASYKAWFLLNGVINSMPASFPKHDAIIAIERTILFYKAIRGYLKQKGHTAFLANHIPESIWNHDRFRISVGPNSSDTGSTTWASYTSLDQHQYFQLLLKYHVFVKDTTYPGDPIYRTFSEHYTRKMIIERLVEVCEHFAPLKMHHEPLSNRLTPDQLNSLCLPQLQPLVLVYGFPGNGKTTVIENMVRTYGKERSLVTTQVACMVSSLRKRGLEADTTAMVINRRYPNIKYDHIFHLDAFDPLASNTTDPFMREAVELVKVRYEKVELLIIDEASNQYDKLFCMLLKCLPNVKVIVLVMDPEQILPIGSGQTALDILEFMKRNQIPMGKLDQNHRMATNEHTMQMIHNDNFMMNGQVDKMEFKDMLMWDSRQPLDFGCYLKSYTGLSSVELDLPDLYNHFPQAQILGFTHEVCDQLNASVDQFMLKRRVPNAPKDSLYYTGQQLTIVNSNYPRKRVSVRPNTYSDSISNGESFTLASIRKLSTEYKARHWLPEIATFARTLVTDKKHEQIFLFSAPDKQGKEKKICVGSGFVNVKDISSGWAVTTDKSQGTQYGTVILVLPSTVEEINSNKYRFVDRNRLHVALTRASDRLVIYGNMAVLRVLAARSPDQRFTVMVEDLSTNILPFFKYRANTEEYFKKIESIRSMMAIKPVSLTDGAESTKKTQRKKKSVSSEEEESAVPNLEAADGMSYQSKLINMYRHYDSKEQQKKKKSKPKEESSSSSSDESSSSDDSSEQEKKKKKKKKKVSKKSDSSDSSDSSSEEVKKKKKKHKKHKKQKKQRREESSSSSSSEDSLADSQAQESDREESDSQVMEESDVNSSDVEAEDLQDKRRLEDEEHDDEPDTEDRMFIASEESSSSSDESESESKTKKKKKRLRRKDGSSGSNSAESEEVVIEEESHKRKRDSSDSDSDEPRPKKSRVDYDL